MKIILLSRGMSAMVDDEDFEMISRFKYHTMPHGNNFYARCGVYCQENYKRGEPFSKKLLMHRQILGIEDPKIKVDHRDGNGLNNQKSNLRICTHSQNMMNRKANLKSSSRFKGVHFRRRRGLEVFEASIKISEKRLHIGTYSCEMEAALAYNVAASFAFREFARLNKIEV